MPNSKGFQVKSSIREKKIIFFCNNVFFPLIPFTSSSSSFVMFWQNLWYLAKYLARKWFSLSIFFDRSITDHSLESALSAQQPVLLKESTGTICAYL